MTSIYSVAWEVKVEAESAEEAQAKVERLSSQLDESEIWSSEVGIAVVDAHETAEFLRLNRDVPGDIQSYGDRP